MGLYCSVGGLYQVAKDSKFVAHTRGPKDLLRTSDAMRVLWCWAGGSYYHGRRHKYFLCWYLDLVGNEKAPVFWPQGYMRDKKVKGTVAKAMPGAPNVVPFRVCSLSQRVQLECHYGIRAPKTMYGMVFGT